VLYEFHDAIADIPGATPARALLVTRAKEYLDRLSASNPADGGLRRELAEAYLRMGDILGGSGRSNLGDEKGAREAYGRARGLLENAGEKAGRLLLAKAYNRLEGYENAEKALGIYRRLAEQEPGPGSWADLANGYFYMAGEMQRAGRMEEALDWRGRELELRRRVYAAAPGRRDAQADLALCNKRIGGILIRRGALREARGHYEEALELEEKWLAQEPGSAGAKMAVTYTLNDLAMIDGLEGRAEKAAERYGRSLGIREELAAADPKNHRYHTALLSGYVRTAWAVRRAGRGAEAEGLLRKARGAEWKKGEVEEQIRLLGR
jgi:eukaryotic-like serine/threonine-protein kinase